MSTQTEIEFIRSPATDKTDTRRDARAVDLLAYTADQVCAALQISKVTLWRLERRGLICALPHLRHKRYAAHVIAAFVCQQSPGPDDKRWRQRG